LSATRKAWILQAADLSPTGHEGKDDKKKQKEKSIPQKQHPNLAYEGRIF